MCDCERIYDAFDYESILVSSTAIGLTAAKRNPTDEAAAERVFCTVETESIRYRIDGPNPLATEGHLVTSGQKIELLGSNALRNFKAIAVAGDATLKVTFAR